MAKNDKPAEGPRPTAPVTFDELRDLCAGGVKVSEHLTHATLDEFILDIQRVAEFEAFRQTSAAETPRAAVDAAVRAAVDAAVLAALMDAHRLFPTDPMYPRAMKLLADRLAARVLESERG